MTAICNVLQCRHPILLGAMGVICNPELVAAVSESGGFGLLATAFASDVERFRNQIQQTRERTRQPFGANLHMMNPLTPELAKVLVEENIRAVTLSGGSPKSLVPYLKQNKVCVMVVVPTVAIARKAASLGVDAIIAEGSESGGIQGFQGASTMVLVPAVVDAVDVPVIAAGGIADSRGYRAALALGASGVQVGTRFIASKECIAHRNYMAAIVERSETGTGLVDLGRFRVRALRTPLVEKALAQPSIAGKALSAQSIKASWLDGDLDAGFLPAGEVTGLIHDIPSAEAIINEMVK